MVLPPRSRLGRFLWEVVGVHVFELSFGSRRTNVRVLAHSLFHHCAHDLVVDTVQPARSLYISDRYTSD